MHFTALVTGLAALAMTAHQDDCPAKEACAAPAKAKVVVVETQCQDAPTECANACSAEKASPVALKAIKIDDTCQDATECASECANAEVVVRVLDCEGASVNCDVKVECATECSSTAATPVALVLDDEEEISFDLNWDNLDQEYATLALNLDDLDIDLEELLEGKTGAIAVMIGEDGEPRVLSGEEMNGFSFGFLEAEPQLEAVQIIADSPADRGYLGVQMELENGMNVTGVLPGSGAEKAGLQAGDRILMVNDKSTTDEDIAEYLSGLRAGDKVKVSYARGDAHKAALIKLQTLAALQGEEIEEEVEEIVEDPITTSDEHFGRMRVRRDGSDIEGLRSRVRARVMEDMEIGEGQGHIRIAIAGEDGEPQIIETREIDLSDALENIHIDGSNIHVRPRIAFGGADGEGRTVELHVEAFAGDDAGDHFFIGKDEDGGKKKVILHEVHGGGDHFFAGKDDDGGKRKVIVREMHADGGGHGGDFIFFGDGDHGGKGHDGFSDFLHSHDEDVHVHKEGRIVVKTIKNGEENVEEYEWHGDHGDLPDHIDELIKKHGGDADGRQIRIRRQMGDGGGHDVERRIRLFGDKTHGHEHGDDHDHDHGHDHDAHGDHDAHTGHGIWKVIGDDGHEGHAIFEFKAEGPEGLRWSTKGGDEFHGRILNRLHAGGGMGGIQLHGGHFDLEIDEEHMKKIHEHMLEHFGMDGAFRGRGQNFFGGNRTMRGFDFRGAGDRGNNRWIAFDAMDCDDCCGECGVVCGDCEDACDDCCGECGDTCGDCEEACGDEACAEMCEYIEDLEHRIEELEASLERLERALSRGNGAGRRRR